MYFVTFSRNAHAAAEGNTCTVAAPSVFRAFIYEKLGDREESFTVEDHAEFGIAKPEITSDQYAAMMTNRYSKLLGPEREEEASYFVPMEFLMLQPSCPLTQGFRAGPLF